MKALWTSTLVILALPAVASAQTFPVTKTADTRDGVCDADCSIREAVDAANASPGGVVEIPGGYYKIERIGYEDANDSGDFDLLAHVTVRAQPGTGTPIIDADGSRTQARVFDVQPGVSADI